MYSNIEQFALIYWTENRLQQALCNLLMQPLASSASRRQVVSSGSAYPQYFQRLRMGAHGRSSSLTAGRGWPKRAKIPDLFGEPIWLHKIRLHGRLHLRSNCNLYRLANPSHTFTIDNHAHHPRPVRQTLHILPSVRRTRHPRSRRAARRYATASRLRCHDRGRAIACVVRRASTHDHVPPLRSLGACCHAA